MFALAVLAALSAGAQDAPAPAVRPNIVFCIADDWSWPHAGAYGDPVVKTPNFDAVARNGVLFTRAFCASPSCTPSRAGILTGQAIHRLAEGANLHGFLPSRFPVYTELLERSGYAVGHTGKGWGPGRFREGGREVNPAGPRSASFGEFLESVPAGTPFCFWFGSHDPHRGYRKGSGIAAGMKIEDVRVPAFLPDTTEVRSDILDYYVEVQRFDRQVGELLEKLESEGHLRDTILVVTSDNGMPFPRAKANLYDSGTRMPLAVQWPARVRGGRTEDGFVAATDFAPTFLEVAGVAVPDEMTGRSLVPILTAGRADRRSAVFLERERHAHVRAGNLGYPARAVRTERWLYVRNCRPDRWPAGDPEHVFSVGPYGDVDASPSKGAMLADEESELSRAAFGKRPAEELYDLRADPWQLEDVARDPDQAAVLAELRARLAGWQAATGDPRADPDDDRFDAYPYFGRRSRRR